MTLQPTLVRIVSVLCGGGGGGGGCCVVRALCMCSGFGTDKTQPEMHCQCIVEKVKLNYMHVCSCFQ